jgi:hypothetical protein
MHLYRNMSRSTGPGAPAPSTRTTPSTPRTTGANTLPSGRLKSPNGGGRFAAGAGAGTKRASGSGDAKRASGDGSVGRRVKCVGIARGACAPVLAGGVAGPRDGGDNEAQLGVGVSATRSGTARGGSLGVKTAAVGLSEGFRQRGGGERVVEVLFENLTTSHLAVMISTELSVDTVSSSSEEVSFEGAKEEPS